MNSVPAGVTEDVELHAVRGWESQPLPSGPGTLLPVKAKAGPPEAGQLSVRGGVGRAEPH